MFYKVGFRKEGRSWNFAEFMFESFDDAMNFARSSFTHFVSEDDEKLEVVVSMNSFIFNEECDGNDVVCD